MLGKDLIMQTLLGSGGSSGGGSSGGGSAAVSPKEVNFYDYDGTLRYAYTVAEAQALSELPAGPEHPGLVFQGWNWSLEGVKGLTRAMNIGAMFTTDDGTTRLYITLQEGRISPMLGVGVNGTVTVDWGDGTEPDVLTGTNTSTTQWTPNHAYAKPGDYVIRLTVDGEMSFIGGNSANAYACILRHASTDDARNGVYQNALRKVEIGDCVTRILDNAFRRCSILESVMIPYGVTSIGKNVFNTCYSLTSVIIPNSVTSIGHSMLYSCEGVATVIIPNSVTKIEGSAFYSCDSVATVAIPNSVTSIGSSAFQYCTNLASVTIPNSVTRIESSTFTNCFGMAYYDFTSHIAVPTLSSTNAFAGIPDDCIFLIPSALYDEWIAATNWTTYADRCVAK